MLRQGFQSPLALPPKNSLSVSDTIPGLTSAYTLESGETYILIAEGIVSPTGYNPSTPFSIKVYDMGQESASESSNTDVLVHHGSTDAPTVDVRERTAGTIVDNASFGDFAGYLELPTANYTLDVQNEEGTVTVASFSAPLDDLSLDGQALVVVASGFLDPSMNSNGPAFGLYVALPSGGELVALPSADGPTARVQVIHNSADAIADSVDVYLDGTLLLDNFAFRNATPFVDVPATKDISIAIAPKTSSTVGDAIATFNYNLSIGGTYILVAEGIVSGSGYDPATPFTISVYDMGREMASDMNNTDVLVHHGSTDAPCVDIEEASAGLLVNNACFGDFAGYLELATQDYVLIIKDSTGENEVIRFGAPLSTLNLDGSALVVVASGFLNPANNSNGASFGLYVALAGGGELVELEVIEQVSISDISIPAISVYPNPSTGIVQIQGIPGEATIEVVNSQGQIIYSTEAQLQDLSIDLSDQTPGLYFININGAGLSKLILL